jgi:hypothetical protein
MSQQEWSAAWVAAWAELPPIEKRRTVKTDRFSYSYADLADVLSSVRPVLAKHGLAVSQSVVPVDGGVGVETRVTHRSGGYEVYGPTVVPGGGSAQQAGAAITYARRYGLAAALGIATEDDTDGPQEAAKPRQAPREAEAPKAAKPSAKREGTLDPQYPLHAEAWLEAKRLFPDEPVTAFVAALRSAGVPEGERITTEAQQASVLDHLGNPS